MRVVGRSVGSVAVSSGGALNELLSLISCSHCFFLVFRFSSRLRTGLLCVFCWKLLPSSFLRYALVHCSRHWLVIFPCWSLFSASVEPIALFIKYVSPLLVIFIGGICMIPRFGDGRLLCRFLFPLVAFSLKHCFARPFRSPASKAQLQGGWARSPIEKANLFVNYLSNVFKPHSSNTAPEITEYLHSPFQISPPH